MRIEVVSAQTAEDLMAQLGAQGSPPAFVSIHCNVEAEIAPVMGRWPETAVFGASSCLGAMTQDGVAPALSAFAIYDTDGSYGAAVCDLGSDPKAAARQATLAALDRADRPGEKPELIWVSGTPGQEEVILAGIESVTGPDVPIIGGSAADNSVSGDWFVFDTDTLTGAGVVVAVLFPSGQVSFAYQNGYAPTKNAGRVTKADGRHLIEIDHRPAAEVYAEWTGGAIPVAEGTAPANILSDSTLWPLGREINDVSGVPYYLLAHPAVGHVSGALDLFATVEEGEVLTQMTGSADSLTERAGRVAALARAAGEVAAPAVKGALMVYCGGCMLSVRDRLEDVLSGIRADLGTAPFLGCFTFGEQGRILGEGNRHGNLMISCIVFS